VSSTMHVESVGDHSRRKVRRQQNYVVHTLTFLPMAPSDRRVTQNGENDTQLDVLAVARWQHCGRLLKKVPVLVCLETAPEGIGGGAESYGKRQTIPDCGGGGQDS